ncbi:MAG: hypothetical protein JO210_11165 [Acidobacteriaceae bacterium]|nr:hypothetical protein [Acidobacteriaceae bacterium]
MRRDPEFFEEGELDLIYMARTLRDALKLEGLLDRAEIDYLVETGTYTAGFLVRRDLTGAFFYVAPEDTQQARGVLMENRYKPYASR